MVIRETFGDKIVNAINVVLLTIVLLIVAYPLYFVVIASFSDPLAVSLSKVYLWPIRPTLMGYSLVYAHKEVWLGYRNTIFYAVMHVIVVLSVTLPAAYALSYRDLRFKGFFTVFFLVTMFFSGGLIPFYLLVTQTLRMGDTVWVLIIPGAASMTNIILARTFFVSSIPEELREAAEIDGCSEFRLFFSIILPLSAAIIAVMSLWSFVGSWNSYFNAMMYLTDNAARLVPLQIVLRKILIQNQIALEDISFNADQTNAAALLLRVEQMKYALIIVSSIPILLIYPFVQKHFVKGVMIGSIKG